MNMLEVLVCKGLPSGGKSTYAKKLVANGSHVRVNKDDLRALLHSSKFSNENEKMVLFMRDTLVEECLSKNRNVVVDDTNFDGRHFKRMCQIADKFNKDIVVRDMYFPITLEEALRRNTERIKLNTTICPNSVIENMYKRYVEGKTIKERFYQVFFSEGSELKQDPSAIPAIICDLDGTVALFTEEMRSPYDASKCEDDLLNEPVAHIVKTYYEKGHTVLFVSGREDKYKEPTEKFLKKHFPDMPYELFMRKTSDSRKDTIIKKEIFFDNINGLYNVRFVLDDRNSVVANWRSMGLTCLQVAEGDF